MNNIVIYHGNCVDGFGAAWCFYNHPAYQGSTIFHPGDYKKPAPDVTGMHVYLVDFSYKYDVVQQMLKDAASVTLIDHHASSINDLLVELTSSGQSDLKLSALDFNRYVPKPGIEGLKVFCSLKASGALLAWWFLNGLNSPPPKLIEHIDDRDRWEFKLPNTLAINDALFSYPYDFDVWTNLMLAADYKGIILDGQAIGRKHNKDVEELLGLLKRRMIISGYDVPVANVPYMMASSAGHKMADNEPFAATYYDTADYRVFSLRSNKSSPVAVNVAKIAELFGGGGHVSASGFSVPRDHILATS